MHAEADKGSQCLVFHISDTYHQLDKMASDSVIDHCISTFSQPYSAELVLLQNYEKKPQQTAQVKTNLDGVSSSELPNANF